MTVTQYAAHRGCRLRAVQHAIEAGRIAVDSNNQVDPQVADAEWEENTAHAMARPGPRLLAATGGSRHEPVTLSSTEAVPGMPFSEARALREVVEVQQKQLELDVRRGLLVRKDWVEAAAFKFYRRLRDALLNIPSRLSGQLAAENDEAKVLEILEAEFQQVFEDFADPSLVAKERCWNRE
jgi:hypothetical protein